MRSAVLLLCKPEFDRDFGQVHRLREQRNQRCSMAEEAEDDVRFAPLSPQADSSHMKRDRSDSAASASHAMNIAKDTATHAATQATIAATNLARNFSQRMRVSPTASAVKQRFDRMRSEAREKELAAKGRDSGAAILKKEELVDEEGKVVSGRNKAPLADIVEAPTSTSLAPSLDLDSGPVKIDELEIDTIKKHPKDWSIIFARAKTQVPTTAYAVCPPVPFPLLTMTQCQSPPPGHNARCSFRRRPRLVVP